MILAAFVALTWPVAVQRFEPIIEQASRETRLPSSWIASVIVVESGGRVSGPAGGLRSPVGAMGLMQVMPGTWADVTSHEPRILDPDRPSDNISVGSAYLRNLYDQFGFPGAFAAYNVGPAAYRRFLNGKIGLPRATQAYIQAVLGLLKKSGAPIAHVDRRLGRAAILFAVETGAMPRSGGSRAGCASAGELFVGLTERTQTSATDGRC